MRRLPLAIALVAITSCAVLDALMPATFRSADDLCADLEQMAALSDECWGVSHEDMEGCNELMRCLQRNTAGCEEEWSAVVECFMEGGDCEDISDAPEPGSDDPVMQLCGKELSDFEDCTGPFAEMCAPCNDDGTCDNDEQGCCLDCGGDGDCGGGGGGSGGYCDSNGLCEPGEGGWCDCGCNHDGSCEPLSENNESCDDCGCDNDGTCQLGESVHACGDCQCNFDEECQADQGETPLSCPDCNPCRFELCADNVGDSCDPRPCRPPLVCASGTCQAP